MTQTSHGHHIAGTPADDEKAMLIINCGGPPVCSVCEFDIRWHKDFAEAKRRRVNKHNIVPGEVAGLDSQIIRNISATLRTNHRKPNWTMDTPKYQLAATIYALADAMDNVAKDLEK